MKDPSKRGLYHAYFVEFASRYPGEVTSRDDFPPPEASYPWWVLDVDPHTAADHYAAGIPPAAFLISPADAEL